MSKNNNTEIPFFDYRRQLGTIRPKIDQAIWRVLNSGKLILGDEVAKFEKEFAKYIGVKYAVGVNSGTDAIKIALRALGIGLGDEIITVANTAVPTVSAIREVGAVPVFVDVVEDYNIDASKIAEKINKKTRAILAVHLYGMPCSIKEIVKIAKTNKIFLVEDCAQAHGATYMGKKVGSFGDIACFSFYPTKNLGAYGDGGMIVTSNKKLADKCRELRMYGMRGTYYAHVEGYNSRLDELQAAILRVKLPYLDRWNKARSKVAKRYLAEITNSDIILPILKSGVNPAWHLFVVRVTSREKFMNFLKQKGVAVAIHYPYPIHLQRAYKFLGLKKGNLPNTEKYANQIVSLPIFPELKDSEVAYIIKCVNEFNA
ncbi:MAG TPA: DegT/DnrJ/EryC1/StrS family aminotransferase [Candidatus Paceibacterota bacterium]